MTAARVVADDDGLRAQTADIGAVSLAEMLGDLRAQVLPDDAADIIAANDLTVDLHKKSLEKNVDWNNDRDEIGN